MIIKKAKEQLSINNPKKVEQWGYFFVACILVLFSIGLCVFAYALNIEAGVSRILKIGGFMCLGLSVLLVVITAGILVAGRKNDADLLSTEPVISEIKNLEIKE